jgi:hypothetical protein
MPGPGATLPWLIVWMINGMIKGHPNDTGRASASAQRPRRARALPHRLTSRPPG